jgi:cell division septum initiation protein DivIVA
MATCDGWSFQGFEYEDLKDELNKYLEIILELQKENEELKKRLINKDD